VIQEVTIKNFKSVQDLTLPLSRFNVFIGSNGSGKSNILEAIAFGSAAAADKLDSEFLSSRGIRSSEPRLMKSAFNSTALHQEIYLNFKTLKRDTPFHIYEEENPLLKWKIKDIIPFKDEFDKFFLDSLKEKFSKDDIKNAIEALATKSEDELFDAIIKKVNRSDESELNAVLGMVAISLLDMKGKKELSNFVIYSPEINSLRKLEEESQIQPVGIRGEGLFNMLQIFNEGYGKETLDEIKDYLHIISWFKDFEAIKDNVSGKKVLLVNDRFISDTHLNQSNVNEGFLFLLFYVSVIISKETPNFFAIDNIEASLHPRLCEELTRRLVGLCKKHNKQVILTTHNPAVLDGLDLDDPEQSLFVIRRNADGETIADKIDKQPKGVKLSEAWERGYIGGQPETIE
jgi:predicted ATPase